MIEKLETAYADITGIKDKLLRSFLRSLLTRNIECPTKETTTALQGLCKPQPPVEAFALAMVACAFHDGNIRNSRDNAPPPSDSPRSELISRIKAGDVSAIPLLAELDFNTNIDGGD